jgi:CubicO group peptidase (beta-lactamase class C family)
MNVSHASTGGHARGGGTPRARHAAIRRQLVPRGCALALILLAWVLPSGALGARAATLRGADRRVAAAIDADLRANARGHWFNGAVLVARRGVVLLQRGYGMADEESAVPNTDTTEFPISALTGQFTAAAVLQLQGQGRLHLRDRLCAYLPACPSAWVAITIQQLLNGSSGLHDYANDPRTAGLQPYPITPARLVALIARAPLDAAPGTACGFYNGSYPVLGYVVSRVAGEPFAAYIRRHFLTPLHLLHTGFDAPSPRSPYQASGYNTWQLPAPDTVDPSFVAAAADMYSTVDDLYRWQQALAAGTVLPPALVATMVTPSCAYCQATRACARPPAGGKDQGPIGAESDWGALDDAAGPAGAGYPWDVGVQDHRRYWGLTGTLPGYVSYERAYPDQSVSVIILSNQHDAPLDLLTFELANRLFGERSQL